MRTREGVRSDDAKRLVFLQPCASGSVVGSGVRPAGSVGPTLQLAHRGHRLGRRARRHRRAGLAPPGARRGLSRRAVRSAATRLAAFSRPATAPALDRHPPRRLLRRRLPPELPRPRQPHRRAALHAQRTLQLLEAVCPLSRQPKRGLFVPQHICSRKW